MKLVDILVRELKEWPIEAGNTCSQDHDKEARFERPSFDFFLSELAEDAAEENCYGGGVEVTRAQWQEARDALNNPAVEVWNGEGLPPAGTICHCLYKGIDQGEVRVEYIGKNACVLLNLFHGDEQCGMTEHYLFTPIRTLEQIAADERLHKLRNAHTAIAGTLDAFKGDIPAESVSRQTIEAMIDAGYVKP